MSLLLPRLYAIVDAEIAAQHGWTVPALARTFLSGGARLLQIRAKAMPSGAFLDVCDEVVSAAQHTGALVIVNDRPDIARLSQAAGVHVGQDDLSVAAVRRLMGPDPIVGLSTHTRAQIDQAMREPASYVAVGPAFGTASKDTGYEAVGLDLIRYAARASGGRPVVAIGGITLERAPGVIEAGAASVAVISDLLTNRDPATRVRAFLDALGG